MVTTSDCRVQSTARRKRLFRSTLQGLVALACFVLLVAPERGRTEPLVGWSGPVPPLSLPTLDGPPLTLSRAHADLVIVHFFATWCETCGPELRKLDRLAAELGARVAIVAVDVAEPEARLRRYFKKVPVGFRIALDADRAAARAWGVFALPSTFILDRSLAPAWQATGDVDWDQPTVRRLLSEVGRRGNSSAGTPPGDQHRTPLGKDIR